MDNLQLISGHLSIAHEDDAGYDIYASAPMTIEPYTSASVPTNLRIVLPRNHFALVKPRSGLSFKNDVETGAGVIDNGYRGEIMVKLYNNSPNQLKITPDKAIAQLILFFQPCIALEVIGGIFNGPNNQEIRGEKGFGSSDEADMNKQMDKSSFNL